MLMTVIYLPYALPRSSEGRSSAANALTGILYADMMLVFRNSRTIKNQSPVAIV